MYTSTFGKVSAEVYILVDIRNLILKTSKLETTQSLQDSYSSAPFLYQFCR